MRAQYKLGYLVEFKGTDKGEHHGRVAGVITRDDGFHYEIADYDFDIAESDIVRAFRPMNAKRAKPRTTTRPKAEAKMAATNGKTAATPAKTSKAPQWEDTDQERAN